ncbi:MAG: SPOR domain-containing protein, partial [Myxococcaceae bacterium]
PVVEAPTPTRTAVKDGGGLREAIARAQRPVEAVPGGAFTLQLSASQDRAEADRFVSKLRGQGYAPFITEAQVAGRGTWYRVRMGSFATKEAAGRYLQDFRRETQLEAFVAGADAK